MIGHLGLERSFQNRFGQLLEQTVFPDDILGLLVVGEQLINQLLVDCHGVFHFLPPIAVYTVLFTPSNESGFTVPRPTLTADSRFIQYSSVRVRGSTPAYSYISISRCTTSVPTLRSLTRLLFRVVACLEENVDERNTSVVLFGLFTHIRIRMRKNHH